MGEAALNTMLALRGGEFHHVAYAEPAAHTLEGSWEFLLMEAARHRDELLANAAERAAESELPPAQRPLEADAGISEVVIGSVQGEVWYERGTEQPTERLAVAKVLHNVGRRMEEFLPFGTLERIEFPLDDERIVMRFHEQGAMFVRGRVPK